MQAVQRFEREKRVDGGKKKEEVDDPHTSAAKRKRPLRNGAELLLAERPSCSCVAACIRHYFPRQGRRLEPRWRASREFHPSEVLSKLRTGVVYYVIQSDFIPSGLFSTVLAGDISMLQKPFRFALADMTNSVKLVGADDLRVFFV